MPDSDMEQAVNKGANAWIDSPYYANAEKWTHLFWGPNSLFLREFGDLDLTNVVELACGHGRHAAQIIDKAGHITLLDVHQANIDASRKRLEGRPNASFFLINGYDFRPVPDESATSIFCYDAMVHFEPKVVGSYISDLARTLKPSGLALLHHSNYGANPGGRYETNPAARNHMTMEMFAGFVSDQEELELIFSKSMQWGGNADLDCLSLIKKK